MRSRAYMSRVQNASLERCRILFTKILVQCVRDDR